MKVHKFLWFAFLVCSAYGVSSTVFWIMDDAAMKRETVVTDKSTHRYGTFTWERDEDYALSQLAIPYINDVSIKQQVSKILWCGTPTIQYLAENPMPLEKTLLAYAAGIEARMQNNSQ
jgi:hypothetical protein